jgi:hypothetical protein
LGRRDKRRSKERKQVRKQRMKESDIRYNSIRKPVNLTVRMPENIPNIDMDEDD